MNREEVIKKFYGKIQKGYLNIKPNDCPLLAVDNCLEVSGKLFMAMTKEERTLHRDLLIKLLNGLDSNYVGDLGSAFIPRTKAIQKLEPKDSKPDRWEKVKPKTWYRTDVSYSQFTFLLQGLRLVDADLTNKGLVYITENKFLIKRHDGKPASNGNFNLWWNPIVNIRKYFIKELTGAKHSVMEKFWFKLMPYLHWSTEKDNGLNLLLVYYSIGGMSENLKQKMKDFITKWMIEFQVKELKDELEWLLLNKIKEEL